MNPSVYYISLDMHTATSQAEIHAIELDSNRMIVATLYENGKPYTITEDCSAILRAEKPDGTVLFNSCTISGNKISYIFTNQTTAAGGIVKCEITLYGGDSKQITSPKFVLVVEKNLYSDSEVEGQDEFTALASAIAETNNLNVSASKSGNVATITVTKKDGTTQTATISDGAKGDKGDPGDPAVIDRTYDSTSQNAQSGTAVADAIKNKADRDKSIAGLRYRNLGGEVQIVGFDDMLPVSHIVVPKELGGYPVTQIGVGAFNSLTIETISLPDTLEYIFDEAFSLCTELTDVFYEGTDEDWNSITIIAYGNTYLERATLHTNQKLASQEYVLNRIADCEHSTNKVTSLSASSTNTQYPSAKCVYDMVGNINSVLANIITPTPASSS